MIRYNFNFFFVEFNVDNFYFMFNVKNWDVNNLQIASTRDLIVVNILNDIRKLFLFTIYSTKIDYKKRKHKQTKKSQFYFYK